MTLSPDCLRAALQLLGCDASRFSFDTRSAVVMAFSDIGDLLLEPDLDGSQVAVWGRLDVSPRQGHAHHAGELLDVLSSPAPYMYNGCLSLRQLEEACAVGGVLHRDCIQDAQRLAQALQAVHARIGQLQGLLR